MNDFTYYGTSAMPSHKHDFKEIKKGSLLSRGKVVKINTYECSDCLAVKSEIITQYPPH